MENEKQIGIFEKYVLRGILLLIGLGLFAWGVFGLKKRFIPTSSSNVSQQGVDDILKGDIAVLNDPKAKPLILSQALRRLGTYRKAEGIKKAKELIEHEEEVVRKAAVEVLAYDSNIDSIEILLKAMYDKSLTIREAAISSLGKKRGSQEVVDALLAALKENKIFSASEKLDIYKALYNLESDLEVKSTFLDKILENVASKDAKISGRAVSLAINIAPNDSRVTNTLRSAVSQNGNPMVMATAIYHLSSKGDEWFREKLPRYLGHKDYVVKMAALNAFPQLCPKDRWNLIKEFLRNEKDKGLIDVALHTPRHLGGKQAIEFLQELLDQTQILGEKYHPLIKQELEATQAGNRKPACNE